MKATTKRTDDSNDSYICFHRPVGLLQVQAENQTEANTVHTGLLEHTNPVNMMCFKMVESSMVLSSHVQQISITADVMRITCI